MKKIRAKLLVILGIVVTALLGVSTWYSVTFNEARLVEPVDLSEYTFLIKDLPMILSLALFMLYMLFLFICLSIHLIKSRETSGKRTVTRTINPKLGLFGLFGFAGFLGFWTYPANGDISPFVFFLFFAFFAFYYEGKMSGTLIDERYKDNQIKAHLKANRITVTIIFLALLVLGQGRLFHSMEYTLIGFVIVVTIAIALELFLSTYLLYRYDRTDDMEESEE